jgi:hypothetical protein
LKEQHQSTLDKCAEKIAESTVVKEIKQYYESLYQRLREDSQKDYDTKLQFLQFKESKYIEEIGYLKEQLCERIYHMETSIKSSLEPFNKKAGAAEKGHLGEQLSVQWIQEKYPDAIIEDTHAKEGFGDLHVAFPNGIKIMIESKNVQKSQKSKDIGKFVNNALQLFCDKKSHGAFYQSHNNEDRTMFPNMEHNPGITYLDKEKKLMVAVLIGTVCTKENSTFLMNVLLDHIRCNKLNEDVEKSSIPSEYNVHTLSGCQSTLKNVFRSSVKSLVQLESNRDFYKTQIRVYSDQLAQCLLAIEEIRASQTEIRSLAPSYFFEEKDFKIVKGRQSSATKKSTITSSETQVSIMVETESPPTFDKINN